MTNQEVFIVSFEDIIKDINPFFSMKAEAIELLNKNKSLSHQQFLTKVLPVELKKIVIQYALERKSQNIITTTDNVILKKLQKNHRKCIRIDITPVGLQNCCFQNSYLSCIYHEGLEIEKGYQITACPCGNAVCLEPHFVNVSYVDGKKTYYDFTRDYNNEKSRYFLSMEHYDPLDNTPDGIQFVQTDVIIYGKGRCKCRHIQWC